jgi:selenocysteine-specific elongation factor
MYVIGTAGHVDHGKSTLVKALTGIDPDRLQEEKEREMTIDLGFAWLTLPSGREVSVVDVPGHERFIKNMLAGVGGIDLALLVVAADESVMPQTVEHLAILDLLRVKRGLVVVTKSDLVEPELVELVKAEVEDLLAGTTFQGSPMVAVSAYTGQGLEELKGLMDVMLDSTEARRDLGRPRLPVDRCFTVSGFGTVVTGTLIDGSLSVGQEVQLVISGERARVRGLQSHQKKVDQAEPGVRLAVNLSGIPRQDFQRGEVITSGDWLRPTTRLDARLRMVRNTRPLKHNESVTCHLFTSETTGRVRLLDREKLGPGEEGWAQIHLQDPLPAVKGDLFVFRSADSTLGGGKVVDSHPTHRHRRFLSPIIQRLSAMDEGTGEESLMSAIEHWGPCDLRTLSQQANVSPAEAESGVRELAQQRQVVLLGEGPAQADWVAYSMAAWDALKRESVAAADADHRQHPLRRGIPREELRSRLGLSAQAFPTALGRLVAEEALVEDGAWVRLPGHRARPSQEQQRRMDAYMAALGAEPYSPPTDFPVDPELLALLMEEGKVVKVSDTVVFTAKAYQQMTQKVKEHIARQGKITVADGRDLFNTSRKYVLPLLEYLDQQHVTRRVGDERVLR